MKHNYSNNYNMQEKKIKENSIKQTNQQICRAARRVNLHKTVVNWDTCRLIFHQCT